MLAINRTTCYSIDQILQAAEDYDEASENIYACQMLLGWITTKLYWFQFELE